MSPLKTWFVYLGAHRQLFLILLSQFFELWTSTWPHHTLKPAQLSYTARSQSNMNIFVLAQICIFVGICVFTYIYFCLFSVSLSDILIQTLVLGEWGFDKLSSLQSSNSISGLQLL